MEKECDTRTFEQHRYINFFWFASSTKEWAKADLELVLIGDAWEEEYSDEEYSENVIKPIKRESEWEEACTFCPENLLDLYEILLRYPWNTKY